MVFSSRDNRLGKFPKVASRRDNNPFGRRKNGRPKFRVPPCSSLDDDEIFFLRTILFSNQASAPSSRRSNPRRPRGSARSRRFPGNIGGETTGLGRPQNSRLRCKARRRLQAACLRKIVA